MTFTLLYASARKGNVKLQLRGNYNEQDGMNTVDSDWFTATVEDLKKIKSFGGKISSDGQTIYSHINIHRLQAA